MLPWLAAELLRIRTDAGHSLTTMAEHVGWRAPTINRIERGERWPRYVDDLVAGYAEVAGIEPMELWRRTLERWARASQHPEAVELANRLTPPDGDLPS